MCSVVGYVGPQLCKSFILQGLGRLEYRGYDSAGFACLESSTHVIQSVKACGKLDNLIEKTAQNICDGTTGIGHTRWATHGGISEENAHPVFDCQGKIALVHNGIIENHGTLRKQLVQEGHIFSSQTDSEVVVHLLEHALTHCSDLHKALQTVINQIEGAYAIVAIMQDHPDTMIVMRRKLPLCIGLGAQETYVASDQLVFADKAQRVVFIPDETFAIVTKELVSLFDMHGNPLPVQSQPLQVIWQNTDKKGYEHYMLKEIYEQKHGITATVHELQKIRNSLWEQLGITPDQACHLKTINIIACGTSYHAARIGQFFFEEIAGIPTRVHLASEFRYQAFFPEQDSIYITVSQSGETADTLEALRMVASYNLPTATITNVVSSTMVREAAGYILTQAGREVSVASTKAFSTQVTVLYWLAHQMAQVKGLITDAKLELAAEHLITVGHLLESVIDKYQTDIVSTLAHRYGAYDKAIFLGRHIGYPFAMEAALKLKEISYIFSQAYSAGELKHGPLALVDETVPVFIFSHQNELIYQKLVSNAQEVKARKGQIISFAFDGQNELMGIADYTFQLPHVASLLDPLVMTGVMQFLVYHIAKVRGCAIDKPRNLAKSVTVE
jgi:glucosamine--fructose-6-phosphate aminotransferase (isomerizing)